MTTTSRRLATLAALAAAAVAGAPAAAHAAAPIKYVALGDSYSAASGVLPPDLSAAPQCLRSTSNYPHLIAQELGADFTDATCGGADTSHFATAQYPGQPPLGAPPQLDALSPDTQLVTLTIGGNDSGVFINTIAACAAASLTAVPPLTGNPCEQQNGTKFEDTIKTTTYPAVVKALQDVKARAPEATVAILTYPHIMPDEGSCVGMPIAAGDTPYVNRIQATLNDAVLRAAAATGVIAVDLDGPSHGHDACQPIGVRWIEPVVGGTNPVVVHPNAFGESEMAKNTLRVLAERGFPASTQTPTTTTTTTTATRPVTPPQSGSASSVGTPPAATTTRPSPAAVAAAASGKATASVTRRLLSGGRLRVACRLQGGATLKSCRVTVRARSGGRTRTLRTVTLAPGRSATVRLRGARRVTMRASLLAADGRRFTATRTFARSR